MSQLRRQGTDHHHHNNYFVHQPPSGPLSPFPPASRHPTSVQSSLTGDSITRDYLATRSDGQSLPYGRSSASPRNPIPFPLHTNSQPYPPSRADSNSSQSPQSPRSLAYPSTPQNRPTISRVAHAAFPAPPSGITPSSTNTTTGPRNIAAPNQNDRDMTERPIDNVSRQTPCTTDSNQSATSSPVSPGHSSQQMSRERPGQRTMPRTSSIDSAISSLSSASQSHKSSFDASAVTQADIDNLIATAGSPEAVIIHLLKEKHHAASQNSQLWRLVDKQRTLILGLNKDLERAMKEKERYKKKVKDLQSAVPPLPPMQEHAQHGASASVSSTINSQGSTSQRQPHNAPSANVVGLQNLTEADWSITPDKERSVPVNSEPNQRVDPQATQPLLYSRQELSTASPTSLASSSSPTGDRVTGETRQDGIPHPIRKPPPAPLVLEPRERTPLAKAAVEDSESEYEDILEVDELPRGRRKTRDDDDRDREAALAREQGTEDLPLLNIPGDVGANAYGPSNSGPQAEFLASAMSPRAPQGPSINGHSISKAPKSPGLPLSPRPEDRPLGSPLPRMPRDMSQNLASMPTSSGNNLSGLAISPRVGTYPNPYAGGSSQQPGAIDAAMRPIPSIDAAVKIDSPQSPGMNSFIYQGLVSDEYPTLLLPPNALPLIQVKVSSSRLRPSRNSYNASRPLEEEPVFTLSVFSRSDNKELWRVEKVIAALPQLDYQLRQFSVTHMKLPDRSIFSGHSPAKIDARRAALNAYFESLLDTPMDERAALVICQFLTSDAIEARDDETSLLKGNSHGALEILRGPDGKPRKEGYLTKRGKNFGGWKARYFVLHGPELKYFESPGGPHLGTIKIYNAQIGKQSQTTNGSPSRAEDDTENQYRHAFLILEPKKKDSSSLVRHVLCAESDEERDAWVEALLEYVEGPLENEGLGSGSSVRAQTQPSAKAGTNSKSKAPANGNKAGNRATESPGPDGAGTVQGFSFDDAAPAEPPVFGPSLDQQAPKSPMFPSGTFYDASDAMQGDQAQVSSKVISAPTNGAVIQDAGAWGNKAATSTKEKKRSIWGFRTRSSYDLASQLQANNDSPMTPSQSTFGERTFVRPVFGIPLAEAVQYCPPQGVGVDADLPAVVYRCIEYLKAKGAESEEGIFRLSGSNVVVKALKERFNTEGDVDFLSDDQYYDVHAVASLFKQYLRELPTSVLTRELHIEFLRVLELTEKEKKIVAFNALVHRLPKVNLALLRALVQFLIIIVNNSDVNKMTVRNVGIVFAPTLNIPAPVFSLFLTEYESIFEHSPYSNPSNVELVVPQSMSPEDIRSPRHQMFSDIPTPADSTFRRNGDPRDEIPTRHDTGFIPMQPSYEQMDRYNQDAGMLMPDSRSAKAKRRESSLLFMDMNQTPGSGLPGSHD